MTHTPSVRGDIPLVLDRLRTMHERRIWPNGRRYLWTDAFGVVLLVSLYHVLGEERYLDQAEGVVAEVDHVLGRRVGIRIGEAPDRDGQYFHYLAMWMFALGCLGAVRDGYRERAVALARSIHPRFVVQGRGVTWKMLEDLSGPYPGYGFGAIDAFHGYVVYRLLAPDALAGEIAEMQQLVEQSYRSLRITQDLGLGMMLWLSHFFPRESWAMLQRDRALATLESMWIDPPGYFCREPGLPHVKLAFTNYGVSLGLQSSAVQMDRVGRLNDFFAGYRSGDAYDRDAITHVMGCTSHLPGVFIHAPAGAGCGPIKTSQGLSKGTPIIQPSRRAPNPGSKCQSGDSEG